MNWFRPRSKENEIEIDCPHCGAHQWVSESISATFCKGCQKNIYLNQIKKAVSKVDQPLMKESIHQRTEFKHLNNLSETKEFKNQETPPKENPIQTRSFSPISSSAPSSAMKTIRCAHCQTKQEVPCIALSSFCEKCGNRINLQDYKIRTNFQGELETRGQICIAAEARVKARLNVGSVVVEGKIEGEILAEDYVELQPNSLVVGQIESSNLMIKNGAGFVGYAVIKPSKN